MQQADNQCIRRAIRHVASFVARMPATLATNTEVGRISLFYNNSLIANGGGNVAMNRQLTY